MTSPAQPVARFLEAAERAPETTLIALDFDGTLSDMVDDPTQAFIHPAARDALARLVTRIGQVAIITGRPVEQVRELGELDDEILSHLVVLGQYGAERLDRHGARIPEPPASIRAAIEELDPLTREYPGTFIEDKQQAVAVHTRRAGHGTLAQIESRVIAVAKRHDLDIEPGREVLELRAHRISKGDALRGIIREVGADAVAMVGDDLGDVPAFDVVAEMQAAGSPAVIVVSGSEERPELTERADVLCDGPAGVAEWLDQVAPSSGG